MILAALRATQSIVVNCWPRITMYRGDILRGLVKCWCNVEEDEPEGSDTIKAAIKDTSRLLTAALENPTVARADHNNLINGNERLSELFKTTT